MTTVDLAAHQVDPGDAEDDGISSQRSRYYRDFEQLGKLGKGGYGRVYKAQNRLDGRQYAVKKIRIRQGDEDAVAKLLREVTTLAKVSEESQHIVGYNTAWIEVDSSSSPDDNDSPDSSEDYSPSASNTNNNSYSTSDNIQNSTRVYIQMELCTSTLQDWMASRNEKLQTEKSGLMQMSEKIMHIFHQILQGVDCIHSNGIIHRDLKPRNIFLQGTGDHVIVKIGDFGLAKDYIPSPDEQLVTLSLDSEDAVRHLYNKNVHTHGVGTTTYAAPEQIKGTIYDSKCDMYSLGIILFEMCQLFTTEMERLITIEKLRRGIVPEQFQAEWRHQAEAVIRLIQDMPSLRPSTQDLLSQLFLTPTQTINTLKKAHADKDRQITLLWDQLQEKDREIKLLRDQLQEKDRQLSHLQQELGKPFQMH